MPTDHAAAQAGAPHARPQLYELVLANGRSASPYVWRIRYALAHKGLEFESVPLGFVEIPGTFAGRFRTVPVLRDGEALLAESWDIALYLDRTRAQAPLFAGASEVATTRLVDAWLHAEILRRMFRIYVLDIHNAARPEDRSYFRESRERRLQGRTLEDFSADRLGQLPALREAFAPLRLQLKDKPFLGGECPNYADYMVLGALQWVASVSTLPLFGSDDHGMRAWLGRCQDRFAAFAGDPREQPLFE
jgi:glutathione S-transferase